MQFTADTPEPAAGNLDGDRRELISTVEERY